ncbi:MAG: hypothetical protein DRQ55_05745 [Planctomycetota bacterium]|nr:MAG: hypothetical protein DRQ55_05745 [Planctomycetota bacterium]
MSRRLLPVFVAALLLGWFAPACGPTEERRVGPGLGQRVSVALAPASEPAPEARLLRRFAPPDEPAAWSVEAPMSDLRPPDWLPPGTASMLLAGAARREVAVRVRCRGEFDATTFQRVDVLASLSGRGGLGMHLELWKAGSLVAASEPQRLNRLGVLDVFSFKVPRAAAQVGLVDELAFVITGGRRQLALGEVRLMATPAGSDLPRPESGPGLVRALEQARPAYGLLEGRPLTASFDVPEGARLLLSCARPRELAGPERGSSFAVELSGAVQRRVVLDAGAARDDGAIPWNTHELDLSAAAGGRVTLRVSLASREGVPSAPLAMALPELVQRGASPATVLLITSDTHRADHLGAQPGNVGLNTPVVDALAARGVLFSDCYAPVNNTNPSHVALMTGTHPRDTGVMDNYHPLSEVPRTLAECFSDAGYSTWAVLSTKHLGPAGSGLGQGFDRVSWPRVAAQRDGVDSIDELLSWLPDADGRPLFVWLHLFDAHTPYDPPDAFAERVWDSTRDPFDPALPAPDTPSAALPPEYKQLRDLSFGPAMYRAELESQDDALRRVLEHPRLARALTAFVADHGESLGEHGMWFDHMGAYPSTLHIPLVLAGPGVPAGRVVDRPVTHLDLGHSLLRLAGVSGQGLPGTDLLAQADSPAPAAPRFTLEAGPLSAAVTYQGLHLVLNLAPRSALAHGKPRALHQVELYDLGSDPEAEHDLAAERPEQAAALRTRLIDWLGAARQNDWLASAAADADMASALAQLGYVAGSGGGQGQSLFVSDECEACEPYQR